MFLAFTRMTGESYCRRFGSVLCSSDIFRAPLFVLCIQMYFSSAATVVVRLLGLVSFYFFGSRSYPAPKLLSSSQSFTNFPSPVIQWVHRKHQSVLTMVMVSIKTVHFLCFLFRTLGCGPVSCLHCEVQIFSKELITQHQ